MVSVGKNRIKNGDDSRAGANIVAGRSCAVFSVVSAMSAWCGAGEVLDSFPSIIDPVHNVASYLCERLDSVLGWTLAAYPAGLERFYETV